MFVALGIEHVIHMRRIIFPSVTSRLYSIFPHYLKTVRFSGKKGIKHKMYVLICYTILPAIFLVIKTIDRDMIINASLSSCKVPVILARF